MKAKLMVLLALLLASPTGQALACATCMGAKDSKSTAHLAVATGQVVEHPLGNSHKFLARRSNSNASCAAIK